MSGDYETLEINQPKISYFKKRAENYSEWLDELMNQIEVEIAGEIMEILVKNGEPVEYGQTLIWVNPK